MKVTASFGVAPYEDTTSDTFDAADRALYEAKGSGKDCVVPASEREEITATMEEDE